MAVTPGIVYGVKEKMPAKNQDLHGSVPDKSNVALLLIDTINALEFPEAGQLARHAVPMAERIAALKRRAKAAGIPAVYVNDNFGRWQSDLTKLIAHVMEAGGAGRRMMDLLHPEEDDYFVLKPKHSGFFSTTLDTLLIYLGVKTLILTGVAGNICVLFTANDAYMRDFHLVIPADCVASNTVEENDHALRQASAIFKADLTPSTELDLGALKRAK